MAFELALDRPRKVCGMFSFFLIVDNPDELRRNHAFKIARNNHS